MAGPSGSTPNLQLPYPLPGDTVDVPRDVAALAAKLDTYLAIPVGFLAMWPTNSPPAGFLICNGALVPAATYPQLASILGSSSGNVTLPDYRDRFPVGAGPTMSLGTKGGSSTVPLSTVHLPAHSHAPGTLKVAAHGHNYGGRIPQQGSGTFLGLNATHGSGSFNNNFVITDQAAAAVSTDLVTDATAAPAVSTGVTANTGGDTAHENRPPYQSVNFIIRAA